MRSENRRFIADSDTSVLSLLSGFGSEIGVKSLRNRSFALSGEKSSYMGRSSLQIEVIFWRNGRGASPFPDHKVGRVLKERRDNDPVIAEIRESGVRSNIKENYFDPLTSVSLNPRSHR